MLEEMLSLASVLPGREKKRIRALGNSESHPAVGGKECAFGSEAGLDVDSDLFPWYLPRVCVSLVWITVLNILATILHLNGMRSITRIC
jgi:hypothetical protein